jgi:bacterioferritin
MPVDKARFIDKLNEAIKLELGAAVQYQHYAQVLTGPDRRIWSEWFDETSAEAFSHYKKFASRVAALGGTPATEPNPVKQTTDLHEMLTNSLEVERNAVRVYTEALEICQDSAAYRNILEEQISDEQTDVEELEKFLDQVQKVGSSASKRNIQSA